MSYKELVMAKKWLSMIVGPWSSSKAGHEAKKQWRRERDLLLRSKFQRGPPTRSSMEWFRDHFKKKK